MATQTFLFNFNEDRFFLNEAKKFYIKRVCTYPQPPLDHLKTIDSLYRGQNIKMALTPQRPNTFFGSNKCKCTFLPEADRKSCEKKRLTAKSTSCSLKEERASNNSKKSKSGSPKKSKSRHGGSADDERLKEIKCMLEKLLGETEDEPEYRKRSSSPKRRACLFVPDECRKCSQKICLRCKMYLESCCCGIPNFLFCKDCEVKYRTPDCSNKDPFACRKCDQKLCLVCRQHLECCSCPKPNFTFCRMCDARMRTRCCMVPDSG